MTVAEITDEMVERGARAHCPWAFEGNTLLALRAEVRTEVRAILTAALSVPRPNSEAPGPAISSQNRDS